MFKIDIIFIGIFLGKGGGVEFIRLLNSVEIDRNEIGNCDEDLVIQYIYRRKKMSVLLELVM